MSIMRIASATALIALLVTTPARAAEPLQPTGKWNVDYGDAHCIASRTYGSAAVPILFALKPSPIGDVMQFSILVAGSKTEIDQYPGTISIDGSPPVKVSVLGSPAKDGKQRMTSVNLPTSVFQTIRPAKVVRLRSSGEVDQSFVLSQMEPVGRALDRCIADLRKVWHLAEAAAEIKQVAKPKTPLPSYFSADDYPHTALRALAGGTVEMMLLVDEAGKIKSCTVTATSGHASLDAQTCSIMARRASFDPALGMDGKPTKSGQTGRIRWVIP